MQVSTCLAIKGAEDSPECRGKPHAFEISTQGSTSQFFVADSCQVLCIVSARWDCSTCNNTALGMSPAGT
jgi:hypothetical protein